MNVLSGSNKMGFWPKIYCLWAGAAIGVSIAIAGLSAESVTRLLVVAFLLAQIPFRTILATRFSWLAPKARFIVLGMTLASIVEGFHMISMPVFTSLRVSANTTLSVALKYYVIDLAFTLPAYLVIFSVIWQFINRYEFSFWEYVIIMGLGQALGDGGFWFFLSAPPMLLFLPYPMTNYHAINVLPFLTVSDHLKPKSSNRRYKLLAVPILILTYFICGTFIKIAGRPFGLE